MDNDDYDGPDYFYDETPDYDDDIMDCGCAEGMCYCEPDEPDLDFGFEHDSSMASAGWGTDEDYGFYGDDEY
jgi:hypothetical protein